MEEKKISLYDAMGVEAHKGIVEDAFKGMINTDYKFAWVNITPDRRLPGYYKTFKVDGDGSKPTLNCLEYLETGNESALEPSADDTHAMPVIDAAAAGFVDEYDFIDVLDQNKLTIPGLKNALVAAYSRRIGEVIDLHRQHGMF